MPRNVRESSSSTVSVPLRHGRPKGIYVDSRAGDLVIKCIRKLLRRNPSLPPARVDDVAIAATTQTGDQGLTIGRTASLLAGLPKSVPGFAIDRMCAGAMTTVTTTAAGRRWLRRSRRAQCSCSIAIPLDA
jgi:acetyl-CoA acyltransferase